jgi:hypothetical protein
MNRVVMSGVDLNRMERSGKGDGKETKGKKGETKERTKTDRPTSENLTIERLSKLKQASKKPITKQKYWRRNALTFHFLVITMPITRWPVIDRGAIRVRVVSLRVVGIGAKVTVFCLVVLVLVRVRVRVWVGIGFEAEDC